MAPRFRAKGAGRAGSGGPTQPEGEDNRSRRPEPGQESSLELEVMLVLFREHVDDVAAEGEGDALSDREGGLLLAAHVGGLHDHDHVLPEGGQVQVHRRAHHLGHVHRAVQRLAALAEERHVLGADAQRDVLRLHAMLGEARLRLSIG